MDYIFYPNCEIKQKGSWTGEKYDVDTSAILTRLIQEAGRICRSHASDLFEEWKKAESFLEVLGTEKKEFIFGFRKSGILSTENIKIWAEANDGTASTGNSDIYSIFVLTIIKNRSDISMSLKEALSCYTEE